MRIAVVTHNILVGDGQGRVNYELVRYLLGQGDEVHLIADRVSPDLIELGATWIPVHPGFEKVDLLKVWRFRHMADKLLDRISGDYDAVYACGAVLTRSHHVNAAHFVHGTWLRSPFHASKVRPGPNGWYQWLFSKMNARWERQAFGNAEIVVALSDMVRRELLEIGVPEERLSLVVNGVDLEEFAPGPADRVKLGLPEGVVLGLFVGDIRSPIKNLDILFRGMLDVPEVHLAVAGTLAQSSYPAVATEFGISDRVHFLGFRRDIGELMRAADMFILPSRRDSCPLVLLEAMASGLPIITSRMVGTSNLVEGRCGFVLTDPDDLDTMVNGLRVLTSDARSRQALGKAARMVAEEHSWSQMAMRYAELFKARMALAPGL